MGYQTDVSVPDSTDPKWLYRAKSDSTKSTHFPFVVQAVGGSSPLAHPSKMPRYGGVSAFRGSGSRVLGDSAAHRRRDAPGGRARLTAGRQVELGGAWHLGARGCLAPGGHPSGAVTASWGSCSAADRRDPPDGLEEGSGGHPRRRGHRWSQRRATDFACRVECRFPHRGLGSANPRLDDGQQRVAEVRSCGHVAVERGVDQLREDRRANVSRGGDCARSAHHDRGRDVGVVAGQHGESGRPAAQDCSVSSSSAPTVCLMPTTSGIAASSRIASARPRPVR